MKTAQNSVFPYFIVPLLLATAAAQATQLSDGESDVQIVSSFVAAGKLVPNECREEAHTFARSLVRYPRPANWHWVLICDEAGWRHFLRLSGRDEESAIYASTDLSRRTTYIRGAKLLFPFDLGANPDDLISHELAHIRLQTSNEASAATLARVWRTRSQEKLP